MTDPAPASGRRVQLQIAKGTFGGDGLAYHEGKVCFVEGALPGEEVLADLAEEKKNFFRARLTQVLKPSPQRVSAPCVYASHCGGCQYQHVSYEEELRMKEAQLAEILKGLPGLSPELFRPIQRSDREYGYRNAVTLHPVSSAKTAARSRKKNPGVSLGFFGKDNVSVIPVQNCLLADPRLAGVFGREVVFKRAPEKISLRVSQSGEVVADTEEKFFRIRLAGESFLVSSRGFFQNNLFVADLLAKKIAEWTRAASPDIFFDIYSGVGVFSFLSAGGIPRIVCVEESPYSIQALRMNVQEGGRPEIRIVEGRAENVFPRIWEKEKSDRAFLVLDPPRQGMAPELCHFLSTLEAATLAYISCDPMTLARDLKIILAGGFWTVKEVASFDMFPRTKHLETAILLVKK